MSLCGACYLWKNGEYSEYGEGYEFEDNMNCDLFDISTKAKEILIEHKKELI